MRKSTKALMALESEEESTSEDSDEDPEIVKEMAMLSNILQYLAKKNKKFMSKGSSHKSSRREEQKGCFNYKKTGHFIANPKRNLRSQSLNPTNSRRKSRRV